MKKRIAFITLLVYFSVFPSAAFASKGSNYDAAHDAAVWILISIFLSIGVGLCYFLLNLPPASIRKAQAREYKTIKEAQSNRLGIVVLSCAIGHPDRVYHEGGSSSQIFAKGPNNLGGWSFRIKIVNSCNKTIKYCGFHCQAKNAVGDPALCEIKKTALHTLRGTGPVSHGKCAEWQFDDFCYSHDMKTLTIQSVSVDYMDGTSETIMGNQLVMRLS